MSKFVFKPSNIPEVIVIEPQAFEDSRGVFIETYNRKEFVEAGINDFFVQDNYSFSFKGVIRGLHFTQSPHETTKLIRCISGEIMDVAVDVRRDSKTFGQWVSEIISEDNHKMLLIPKGFAHGFCVLSDKARISYKVTDYYHPESDLGIIFNDPDLSIPWPLLNNVLSEKDKKLPFLKDLFK